MNFCVFVEEYSTKGGRWVSRRGVDTLPLDEIFNPARVSVILDEHSEQIVGTIAEVQKGRMFIRFVGTHAEYDRIDGAAIRT